MSESLTIPEAGKKTPPAVSTEEMRRRLKVKIVEDEDHQVNISHVFSPQFEELLKDDVFIETLLKDVIALCSVATIQVEKMKIPATTSHLVSFVISYIIIFVVNKFMDSRS